MTTISIATIASQLKMNPKNARAKLRALGNKVPKGVSTKRYEFSKADAAKVKSLLK